MPGVDRTVLGALVLVRRLPVFSGIGLRPLRHVSVLFVFQFIPVLLVAALALDVIGLGAGRLSSGAGTEARFQMVYRHAFMPQLPLQRTPFPYNETGIVRPLFPSGLPSQPGRHSISISLPRPCYHL